MNNEFKLKAIQERIDKIKLSIINAKLDNKPFCVIQNMQVELDRLFKDKQVIINQK